MRRTKSAEALADITGEPMPTPLDEARKGWTAWATAGCSALMYLSAEPGSWQAHYAFGLLFVLNLMTLVLVAYVKSTNRLLSAACALLSEALIIRRGQGQGGASE